MSETRLVDAPLEAYNMNLDSVGDRLLVVLKPLAIFLVF